MCGFLARDKRRPVGDNLAHGRAAVAEACCGWGTVQHQRHELAREAVDCLLVLAADADTDLDFGWVVHWRRCRTMTGVRAEVLRVDLVELQAELLEPRTNDAVGGLRFL
jgi:hypothetical protein